MRMMFAVGSLNRARSKIVVAGRLREMDGPAPPTPQRRPPAGPGEGVRRGTGRGRVDRACGRDGASGEGIGASRHPEGGGRVH